MSDRIVKSAERTLLLFEYFAIVRRGATANEIENALALPQSSNSMLLRCLVRLGYLEYSADSRCYQPTSRVAIFSDWLKPLVPQQVLTKQLNALRESTGGTVLVGLRHGHYIHYVRTLRGTQELQYNMREGSRRRICESASGRALLSGLPDATVLLILRQHNAERDRPTIDEGYFLKRIAQIRSTGFSETDPHLDGERDFHAIATVLPVGSAAVEPYSLGVAGPLEAMIRRRERIKDMIRDWLEREGAAFAAADGNRA